MDVPSSASDEILILFNRVQIAAEFNGSLRESNTQKIKVLRIPTIVVIILYSIMALLVSSFISSRNCNYLP